MEMGSNSFQVSTSTFIDNEVRYGNKRICLGNSGRVVKQPPRCQVEGCNVDLSGVKAYYCRHKVCGMHSKSPMVIVAGSEQRFCQQCSRFHQLAEFDQGKRSCRRRLACHNERRRKPHSCSSSRPSCNGLPSSPFHAQLNRAALDSNSRLRSFLMNFSYPHLYQGDVYAFSLLSTHPLTNVLLVKESQTPPPPTTTTNGVLSNNGFGDVASNMQTNNSFASSEVRPALQKKRQLYNRI